MSRGSTWTNSDGLVVGFGTHTEDNSSPAVSGTGTSRQLQFVLDATVVPDTASATNGIATPQAAIIPRGSVITRATITVLEAFTSGGAATLDLGLWTRGLATDVVDDADGIVSAVTIAELTTVGEIHLCDGALLPLATSASTLVGATGLGDCVVTAEWATAAYTAGKGIVRIEYEVPFGEAGRSFAAV
jgi:hypothetical protein